MAYGRIFSKKVELDGIKFDSEIESIYYLLLKDRLAKGEIKDLEIHKPFVLLKEFVSNGGKKHKELIYECDFFFFDNIEQRLRIVDTKGMLTDDFIIKWKLFDRYLIDNNIDSYLEVLKYSKSTGWVDYENYKKARRDYKKALVEKKNEYKKQSEKLVKDNERTKKELARYYELKDKVRTKSEETRFITLKEKLKDYLPRD